MPRLPRPLPLPLLAALAAPVLAAEPTDPELSIISLQVENDLFGDGFDRHYTNGLRLNAVTERRRIPDRVVELAEWLGVPPERRARHYRLNLALGQSMFTPENTAATAVIPDDRPYAGWLYLGAGVAAIRDGIDGNGAATGIDRLDLFELNLGVIGPASLAEEVQVEWHRLIDAPRPRGWDNQLDNELGINLYGSRQWRWPLDGPGGLRMDLTPHLSYALGNVHTHGGIGVSLRIGGDLDGDFGPPRIRPSLPAGGFFRRKPDHELDWYLFAGVEARLVARNIFLDGNTFGDSHHVDKNPWVADFQAGLVITCGGARLSFTNVWRTREFTTQTGPTEFGAITATWHF